MTLAIEDDAGFEVNVAANLDAPADDFRRSGRVQGDDLARIGFQLAN